MAADDRGRSLGAVERHGDPVFVRMEGDAVGARPHPDALRLQDLPDGLGHIRVLGGRSAGPSARRWSPPRRSADTSARIRARYSCRRPRSGARAGRPSRRSRCWSGTARPAGPACPARRRGRQTLMKMRGAVRRSPFTVTVSGPSNRACPRISSTFAIAFEPGFRLPARVEDHLARPLRHREHVHHDVAGREAVVAAAPCGVGRIGARDQGLRGLAAGVHAGAARPGGVRRSPRSYRAASSRPASAGPAWPAPMMIASKCRGLPVESGRGASWRHGKPLSSSSGRKGTGLNATPS